MGNVRTIYLDWQGGTAKCEGGPHLARRWDHLSNLVVFQNAPQLENYYLLVEMKSSEDDIVASEMEPIQLSGPYWLVPNVYTQILQPITFQVVCLTEEGDFEQSSAKFTMSVVDALPRTGKKLDVDPSVMFDPYKEYVDRRDETVLKAAKDAAKSEAGIAAKEWLDDHPDARIPDESITEQKISSGFKAKSINSYATPEMFGAKGDGVTDDTTAWQRAVDSGFNVKATKKAYKCGKITVTKNIEIDCNGADFICTNVTLFECSGSVSRTLAGESDYTANDSDYAIKSAGYTDYTGFAMLKGTNNFMPTRDYYKGGFVCAFNKGTIVTSYPIGVSSVSIELVDPITVDLHNIGDITHDYTGRTFSIVVEYGSNCKIHDINGKYSSYTVISLDKCINCFAENLNIENDYTGQSYIVVFANSSYCEINKSLLHNREWHAATTGDIYLCYKNKIKDCVLTSTLHYAYADHHNGLGTIIEDSTVSMLVATGLCCLKNLTITPNNSGAASIRLFGCPLSENAIYDVSDIVFDVDSTSPNNSANGIIIVATADQVPGKTFCVNRALIKNCKSANSGFIYFTTATDTTESLVLKDVTVDGFQGNIYGGKANNIDISNYVLTVRNIRHNSTIGSSASMEYNVVILENSKLYAIRGIFAELRFSMIEVVAQIKDITVNSKLIGDMLIGYIPNAQLLIPTRLSIGMISVNDNYTYFNYVNDNNGNKYYSSYINGTLTPTKIA